MTSMAATEDHRRRNLGCLESSFLSRTKKSAPAVASRGDAEEGRDWKASSRPTTEGATCAICFEQHSHFVELPCSCRVDYCHSCWNRALAHSVLTRGKAQCPSCRSGFHIDFDEHIGGLVFHKQDTPMSLRDWRENLYGKAKPVQTRLLQNFGKQVKKNARSQKAGKHKALEGMDGQACCEPLCICGGVLEKIDARTRIIRMLDDTRAGWRSRATDAEELIRMLGERSISCDLCENIATRTGAVWTCKNGPHTVLHPAAYDVCETCFMCHAGLDNHAKTDVRKAASRSPSPEKRLKPTTVFARLCGRRP